MTVYINILENVQKNMANEILLLLENDLEQDTEAIAVSILLVVIVIVMCPLTLRAIWSLTSDIQNYALTLAAQTKALNKEKKRSNWLLYSMLPPTVAEQLVLKKDVKAESYASASVLFSDIVGFNHLCAVSSPMQVVEMLNGLYLVFDSRIEHYKVYKVETVNETYMLAAGLPSRMVGGEHVTELATVALDLLHQVSFLEVPHRENMKIKIRIGIHTGPVVAGVVGIKMPRYCLFGDTVNTASRMQTSGLPGRIHVTSETYLALQDIGGFMLIRRGEIEIKGKGVMTTYWLTGRENFEQIIQPISEQSNIMNDPGLHEVRYTHMYEQTSTGRIQYRIQDDVEPDWKE
ncbi:guanylate cyclase 2G-like [Acanthaster planci]|uniref:guanylate cyclase n=1 Tax=Acanthaster planci TaxID=133434 RepID=A0A8B7ZTX3_ACAPL|nr:guanylate cyclase 2G-like [Acanthaster planci]